MRTPFHHRLVTAVGEPRTRPLGGSRCGASTARARRGAALVETALVLPVFLFIIFAAFDLSLAVFRYNSLSAAARRLARQASLHGALAPPKYTTWGPATMTGTGADSSQAAQAVQSYLFTFNTAAVQLQVNWLDGDIQPDDRVQVTLKYPQTSLVGNLFGYGQINLQAVSTMRILH
ncbi:MAG TPA: TadE family protein [Pirellulales bacterium]|nr:TadE family protein [Pirellulales bacterium]